MSEFSDPLLPDIEDTRRPDRLGKLKISQSYPWITGLLSLLVVGYFLILHQPQLVAFYHWPEIVQQLEFQALVAGIYFCIVFWEVRRFYRQRRRIEQHIEVLKTEVEDVWRSKKSLQARAHVYSDHADKLKLFISDKLLEYIEYDEKFLHFKSIAAEVRHNGVISYDKVKTALHRAAEEFARDSQSMEISNPDPAADSVPAANPYQDALDAMRYLWDLLDLSTTDNIALHIGNYLIECEEHYYQLILNKDRPPDHASGINPIKPHFSPQLALMKTIAPMLESAELSELAGITRSLERRHLINQHEGEAAEEGAGTNVEDGPAGSTGDSTQDKVVDKDKALAYAGSQFRLRMERTPTLLGNENHLILLLENLIKNAQFFANKTAFKQKSDRIAVQLHAGEGYVHYSIYNRGPHIDEADRDQIFQLGYSTRRVKEHHGKGLGLFFVNEIVKGYQGRIQIENIDNQDNTYSIRIAFKNGEVATKVVKTLLEDGRPLIHEDSGEESGRHLQWEFSDPVDSIEVSSTTRPKTCVFKDLDSKQATSILDPHDGLIPQWAIDVKPKRGAHKVQFTALDVGGVQFHIKLPTADSRLSGEELPFEENLAGEVEKLNEQFKEFGEF